ncbi:DUF2497 domain-containing protein [Erythrobacter sp. JK5]|uniref:DUF2497 domain-containing protein n=1 Tax=Erythrobacter sp. JK5 TaxID=2829500 RepID=UPI001BA60004|nr:DUF2497 domain-containing protein [Erythrobacter sp. JK5]QUL37260.1 DUF2497 domain-containing protein [Erythrobacter sp. JK5]
MAQNNEASVEEILESIKRVIARDNRDEAMEARRRRVAEADDAAERPLATDSDGPQSAEAEAEEDAEEILDLADMQFPHDFAESAGDDELDDSDGPLIAENVRGAMQENLAALAMLAEPGAKPQIVRSGETSLEGLTRELLRPMLAEWLDRNLPTMVEKLVRAEISRIAGKKG